MADDIRRPSPCRHARRVLPLTRTGLVAVVLLSVLAAAGGGPSSSSAQAPPQYGVEVTQALYDERGLPLVQAVFEPDSDWATPTWSVCAPGLACLPATSAQGLLRAGFVVPGTAFEASAAYQGSTYNARSPIWTGSLSATRRPRLRGRPVAGRTVAPVGGSWTGGWDQPGDFSRLRVEACRTAKARGCVTLSAQGEDYPGQGRPPRIARRHMGWYLFAIDMRFSGDVVFAGVGYASAGKVPTVRTGATVVRSAPLGPVRRAR